ncbi:unnamed protein product, partial [Meganyctiphanes norvegica]
MSKKKDKLTDGLRSMDDSFQLHVTLKRGKDLVAMDARGTSDPYVKFKVNDKLLHKSKIVYNEINPTWYESFSISIQDKFEPVIIEVFDYDIVSQDDFMGMALLDITKVELNTWVNKTLLLQDPINKKLPGTMGNLQVSINLEPNTQADQCQDLGDTQIIEHYSVVDDVVLVTEQTKPK